ncbi:PH domain-containing protein [Gilvimarinus polysaccharolyticus]|uniref:PH domain-containing protein n=1 Tax=Gilvimarinus polysaccharolyticus TaxID=863921 RepID=UPI0006731687|nr:PH domain-containing protein [Gilvimarinus polysaccharolyticus]
MQPNNQWQRVSPIATVYFFVKSLPHLMNFWPALVPLLAGGEQVRRMAFTYGIPAALLLLVVGVFLQYWFFSFKVEEKRLTLRSGVLNRKRLTLDFERVQQADIVHPFYFRPFGLATLGFESAGSAQQEVDVPGLSVAAAESLRRLVLEQAATAELPADDASATTEADFSLRLGPAEILRYGLMHNTLLYLAPLAAPLGQYIGPLLESSVASIEHSQAYALISWVSENLAISATLVLGLLAVLAGTTLLFGLSVVLALVRYWDYQLTRVGDSFQYRAGLTTIRTRGFKHYKLQKVTITQGLIARLLRRHSMVISKAGSFGAMQAQNNQRFEVPVLDIINLLLLRGELSLPSASWQWVSRSYWLFPVMFMAFLLGLSVLFGCFLLGTAAVWGLLLLPLIYLYFKRRWYCLGYYRDSDWLALRTGFIGFTERWLPTGKLQKIRVVATPISRCFGLVHLQVWSADGVMTIPCLPIALANQMRDSLLTDVVNYRRAWL